MDKVAVIQAIDRLRRHQPRNSDVLLVCEIAEAAITKALDNEQSNNVRPKSNGQFDKVAYQRDYMRKRRANQNKPWEKQR